LAGEDLETQNYNKIPSATSTAAAKLMKGQSSKQSSKKWKKVGTFTRMATAVNQGGAEGNSARGNQILKRLQFQERWSSPLYPNKTIHARPDF
jgi:hypothetical protein